MAAWLQVLIVLAGAGVVIAIVALARKWARESGGDAERAKQSARDLDTARDQAAQARKSGDVRHEIDRDNFGDAVDKL